jgi:uncharacterized cupin superfamily protein
MTHQIRRNSGLAGLSLIMGVILTLAVQSSLSPATSAVAAEKKEIVPPQSWTTESLNTMKLDALGDIDWITVESGSLQNSETALFDGDNIVLVWEGGPAKLIFDEPTTYDEFVVVLKGDLILSYNNGNKATYKPGDMFMLPKGFEGSWEMTSEYRELIVVDSALYNASYDDS